MLVLTRSRGEAILIDGGITVTVLEVKGERVLIGVDAPQQTRIKRSELPPLQEPNDPTLGDPKSDNPK